MKVAVIQMNSVADKRQNINRALEMVNKAIDTGARFVLLPEVFNFRGAITSLDQLQNVAEKISGPSISPFQNLAQEKKVFILAGSIFEKVKGLKKAYNTSVLINPDGKIAAKYRKINLFDAVIPQAVLKEPALMLKGNRNVMANVGDFHTGLSICYDLRFPELYRKYARQNSHILCVPSAVTKYTGEAHFEILLRARAIENMSYVLAPNQVGKDGRGVEAFGGSMIIGPWGNVLAKASNDREEIIYADISLGEITEKRKILPALRKFLK